MEHIKTIMDKGIKPTHTIENETRLNENATELVNQLFQVLIAHVSYFSINKTTEQLNFIKREWVKTFIAKKVTAKEIKIGVERIRKGAHLQDLKPQQFLLMCKPTLNEIGAPELEQAYLEACKNAHPCETNKKWSHVAVRLAAQGIGSHRLLTESRDKTFKDFERHYNKAIDEFLDGKIMNRIEFDEDEASDHEVKKEISKGYEHIKSRKDAMSFLKDILS
jgi:hypothetical protein